MPKLSISNIEKNKYLGMSKGINFAIKNKVIFSTLLIISIGNLTAFTFESMTPYFARFIYNSTPEQFSLMISMIFWFLWATSFERAYGIPTLTTDCPPPRMKHADKPSPQVPDNRLYR